MRFCSIAHGNSQPNHLLLGRRGLARLIESVSYDSQPRVERRRRRYHGRLAVNQRAVSVRPVRRRQGGDAGLDPLLTEQ
ncbi:hypothetical protein EYF80_059914 [Liparis tanakae]|uniref:Uncharacterized protein n=1 Tax=Liparis tanakae TaxID=230148 RepID=A0A4Z2EME1_9TELE|nr:hypothetical protein EYF80_059914 [Liparis tanakae]